MKAIYACWMCWALGLFQEIITQHTSTLFAIVVGLVVGVIVCALSDEVTP